MNVLENLHIHFDRNNNTLISEKSGGNINPLFEIINKLRTSYKRVQAFAYPNTFIVPFYLLSLY